MELIDARSISSVALWELVGDRKFGNVLTYFVVDGPHPPSGRAERNTINYLLTINFTLLFVV